MKIKNIIKKVLIFIAIVIIPNFVMYTYPMHKIYQMSLNETGIYTLNQSKILKNYTSILTSNISDEYKQDTANILVGYKDSLVYQRDASLKAMFYFMLVYIIFLLVATIYAFKKYVFKDKKSQEKKNGKRYIAYAFLIALIISVLLFAFLIYSKQYMFIAK